VFYFTCSHVWNWNKIIWAAEIISKLFQRHWICWKIFVSCNKLLKVATLPREIQKIIFPQYCIVTSNTSEENKLLPLYTPHLKNVTTLPCKMQLFHLTEGMLHSSKLWWLWKEPVVGWHYWLYKEPVVICGKWNVRQAT